MKSKQIKKEPECQAEVHLPSTSGPQNIESHVPNPSNLGDEMDLWVEDTLVPETPSEHVECEEKVEDTMEEIEVDQQVLPTKKTQTKYPTVSAVYPVYTYYYDDLLQDALFGPLHMLMAPTGPIEIPAEIDGDVAMETEDGSLVF